MSLIMDALKKAQQLRSKESKGAPLSKSSLPKNMKAPTGLGKRWIFIGSVFAGLGIAIFVFLRPVFQPITPRPSRAVGRLVKQPALPVVEKKIQESTNETASPEPMERPKDILSQPKETPSPEFVEGSKESLSLSRSEREDKATSGPKPVGKEKSEEPFRTKAGEEKKVGKATPEQSRLLSGEGQGVKAAKQIKSQEKLPAKKDAPPTHLASLKEEAFSKPSGLEKQQQEEKIRMTSSEAIHHFNLAVSFSNQRDNLKAVQAYQKAIELNPAYSEAYNNLGITYQELGDFNKAMEAYQKAIETNPQYEKAYNNLGTLLFLNGRLEEAVEAFQKALAINPNNVESLINLGVIFKKQGQFEKGIDAYQRALGINPLRGETHYNIAILYEETENFESAVDHYRKFIQHSSKLYPALASKVQNHLDYLLKAKNNKEGARGEGFEGGK